MVFCHQVHLDKTVTLLDSPGIVFSTGKGDAAAALRNCLKVRDPSAAVHVVFSIFQHIQTRALHVTGILLMEGNPVNHANDP